MACETSLDKQNKKELKFDELSPPLQEIYSSSTKNHTTDYLVYSLDENFKFSHYWTGAGNKLLTKGFNHHFEINGKKFKLSANQGDPFVLDNMKLYYTTELNPYLSNVQEATFIEIDLKKYLEK